MKVLAKGIYYYKKRAKPDEDQEPPRLWHDCKKYKDRDSARVEVDLVKETKDFYKFVCKLCGFEYEFDKTLYLNLP
jgi:hypothetical protein